MPTTLKPEINIPLRLTISGAAIWPGRTWNDPETGTPKQLPSQLALKGSVPGASDVVTVYVPVDLASVLVTAGASHKEVSTKGGVKGIAYDLPATRREWIVCKRQAAGEKHPHVELYEPDGQPGAVNAPPDFTAPPKALQTPLEVMPWDQKPAVHLEREAGEMTPLENLFGLWDDCLAHAITAQKEHPEIQLDIAAATATLFIQATKLR